MSEEKLILYTQHTVEQYEVREIPIESGKPMRISVRNDTQTFEERLEKREEDNNGRP